MLALDDWPQTQREIERIQRQIDESNGRKKEILKELKKLNLSSIEDAKKQIERNHKKREKITKVWRRKHKKLKEMCARQN